MAENTSIEWTEHTFNPVRGCRKLSTGCKHCYAETLSKRFPETLGEWGPDANRVMAAESYWRNLAKWNRAAEKAGEIHRVFVASLADVFEGQPLSGGKEGTDGPRVDYLPMLERLKRETADLKHLRFLVLTKRPGNMLAWAKVHGWPWNWWAGTSVEDQAAADLRVPLLCEVPAGVRFLSMEPLLGAVDLESVVGDPLGYDYGQVCCNGAGMCGCGGMSDAKDAQIHWVIVGGESGPKARPMHPDWVRGLRLQCVEAGVPFLFKQWGAWSETGSADPGLHPVASDPLLKINNPQLSVIPMARVGKKAAGRLLDGRTWDEFPECAR